MDDAETARWTAWKRASDVVLRAVADDIGAATGLSGADFAVLTRVVELGDGRLRQQELARLLGWERSRLSRQISRMESRGLLVRIADGPARMITATDAGHAAVAAARPAHAAAVRRALIEPVPAEFREQFWAAIAAIAAGPVPPS